MKGRYPLRPLRVPALLGLITAFALLAALLDDGFVEGVSILLLASVVGLVVFRLVNRIRLQRRG